MAAPRGFQLVIPSRLFMMSLRTIPFETPLANRGCHTMTDLSDGQSVEMKGSGAKPYVLKNTGGVYTCTCPAWRNQSPPIERGTCKHPRKLRGDAAETERLGGALPQKPVKQNAEGDAADTAPPLLLAENWD